MNCNFLKKGSLSYKLINSYYYYYFFLVFRGGNNYQILQWEVGFFLHILSCSTIGTRKKYIPFIKLHIIVIFRCVFGALSVVYICNVSFLLQPWWLTIIKVNYILTIIPPFPQQSKLSYSTASRSNRKTNIQKLFSL